MQWLYLDANQQQVSAEEEQLGDLVQQGLIQAETMLWNESMSDWQAARALWPDTFQAAVAAPPVAAPPVGGPPMIKRRGSKPVGRPSRIATKKAAATRSKTTGKPAARGKSKPKATSALSKRGVPEEEEDGEVIAANRKFSGILLDQNGWLIAVAGITMVLGSLGVLGGIAALVASPNFLSVIPIVLGVIPIGVSVLLIKASGSIKLAVESGHTENLSNALSQLGKYFFGMGIFLLIFLILIVITIAIAILSPSLFIPSAA